MTETQTNPRKTSTVTLREIDEKTVRGICDLTVGDDQTSFVAPNAVSIAEAHFSKEAWFRAIYADETPVGFVMISDNPVKQEYFLWRFMVDSRFQGKAFGRKAIELLVEHVKTRPGAKQLLTSVVQGPGGPQPFYEKLGFALTGVIEDGEAVMKRTL